VLRAGLAPAAPCDAPRDPREPAHGCCPGGGLAARGLRAGARGRGEGTGGTVPPPLAAGGGCEPRGLAGCVHPASKGFVLGGSGNAR